MAQFAELGRGVQSEPLDPNLTHRPLPGLCLARLVNQGVEHKDDIRVNIGRIQVLDEPIILRLRHPVGKTHLFEEGIEYPNKQVIADLGVNPIVVVEVAKCYRWHVLTDGMVHGGAPSLCFRLLEQGPDR